MNGPSVRATFMPATPAAAAGSSTLPLRTHHPLIRWRRLVYERLERCTSRVCCRRERRAVGERAARTSSAWAFACKQTGERSTRCRQHAGTGAGRPRASDPRQGSRTAPRSIVPPLT